MAGDGDLVIREELLGRLLGSAAGAVWDVQGIAGAGKSVLLREVQRRASLDDAVVVLVEMQDYFTAFEQWEVAKRGDGSAGEELRRFGRALMAVLNGLRDRPSAVPGGLEKILNDIGAAVRDAGNLNDEQAHERADGLIGQLREEVNGLIEARVRLGRRVYLLVDTFELVLERPLGQWLLRVLDGLDGAVVAVARRASPGTASLPEAAGITDFGELEILEVGPLSREQARDYLKRRLGTPGEELAAAVHQFTGGHALAVGLTADLAKDTASDLRRRGEPVTADALLGEVTAQMEPGLDEDRESRLSRLVARFIESARERDPALGEGLDCLWAVRRFDFTLLEHLLGAGSQAGQSGGHRLAERLVGYSFVEQRTPRTSPGRPAEPYYVVHDRVRQQGLELPTSTTRLKKLREVAQEYYQGWAIETLDGYERWFQYEDEGWQAIAREWLYHVAQLRDDKLRDDKRGEGRLGVTVLFMDAFWWWGNYAPFPFCEELLTDWAEMADAGRNRVDAAWGQRLREIYDYYPKGWRRQAAHNDDWSAVRQRLIQILAQRELQGKKPRKEGSPEKEGTEKDPLERERQERRNERIRHVRGFLYIYLAEAERFLNPHNREVDQLLAKARELFNEDDDEWDAAWVPFQQADAMLARGDAADAVAAANGGWRLLSAMDDDDFELAANLHRIHADAAWARGERGLALDLYARAALSAYKFQVAVGDPDIPPVDEYTQAFMAEMHERAAERLSTMHEAGEDWAVRDACARIRQFFQPYWRATGEPELTDPTDLLAAGRAEDAVRRLFPPVPSTADLHQPDTAYERTAIEVLYDMEDELAEPPGTALPSAS